MDIACFSLTFWRDKDHADYLSPELNRWYDQTQSMLKPKITYLACGTKIDVTYNPLPVPIVQAEVAYTKLHDVVYWAYSFCAESAALWYAILNTDCDIIAHIATDCVLTPSILPRLEEFKDRSELIMAPSWFGFVEDAAIFYKRNAVIKFLNERKRANLVDKAAGVIPPLSEPEKTDIFRTLWWNPWPDIFTMRQEYGISDRLPLSDDKVLQEDWPLALRPSPFVRTILNGKKNL